MRVSGLCLAAVIALTALDQAVAKDITETLHWNVQASELSVTRLRLGVAPKVYKAACKYYWKTLQAGGTIHVNIAGAGDQIITSFHVTKDKCAK